MAGAGVTAAENVSAVRLLHGYGRVPLDEAIDPDGGVREPYRRLLATLDEIGHQGIETRRAELERYRAHEGIVFTAHIGGEYSEQVFPLDPVPRLIGVPSWAHLRAGAAQRARALNAFLADVYSATSQPSIVADGIIPQRVVQSVPGYRPAAAGLAPGGHPRATVHGLDLLTDQDGHWVVLEDNLQVPSGLGYTLANRRSLAAAFPELIGTVPGVRSPEVIGSLLRRALMDAAPPRCQRSEPQVVVLSDGPVNSAWYEHRTLAAEMGVPVVHPDDLVADGDSVAARTATGLWGIDVVYRRLGNDELLGETRAGELLRTAAAAGTVSIANAPGNGVADDKAVYAFVGPMIRYYLGEEPVFADVGTWVLGEPDQYAAVRGRMGELVIKPVDGSGGEGVMIGPELTKAQIAQLEEHVAQAPHRFIAQEVIRFSTHPTLSGSHLRPRHVDLRLFVLSGAETVVVPAGLTRVALEADGLLVNSSQGGGSKDTWLTG
jgi:carboxylate-amine ligase